MLSKAQATSSQRQVNSAVRSWQRFLGRRSLLCNFRLHSRVHGSSTLAEIALAQLNLPDKTSDGKDVAAVAAQLQTFGATLLSCTWCTFCSPSIKELTRSIQVDQCDDLAIKLRVALYLHKQTAEPNLLCYTILQYRFCSLQIIPYLPPTPVVPRASLLAITSNTFKIPDTSYYRVLVF